VDGVAHLEHLAGIELWSIYEAEGKPKPWATWLSEIQAFKPRLVPMARFVAFAMADARWKQMRSPEPVVAPTRWAL
jgi:hypothetical protein